MHIALAQFQPGPDRNANRRRAVEFMERAAETEDIQEAA